MCVCSLIWEFMCLHAYVHGYLNQKPIFFLRGYLYCFVTQSLSVAWEYLSRLVRQARYRDSPFSFSSLWLLCVCATSSYWNVGSETTKQALYHLSYWIQEKCVDYYLKVGKNFLKPWFSLSSLSSLQWKTRWEGFSFKPRWTLVHADLIAWCLRTQVFKPDISKTTMKCALAALIPF